MYIIKTNIIYKDYIQLSNRYVQLFSYYITSTMYYVSISVEYETDKLIIYHFLYS